MTGSTDGRTSKVPEVTAWFWLVKIAATTLGETAGDAVSMTFGLGYLVATGLFAALFLVVVAAQVRASRFHPLLYWAVIVATTTVGTTLADFADRSLGIGYLGGSLMLFTLVLAVLGLWRAVMGSISSSYITGAETEIFYWATILASNTLGTALGDWLADDGGLGYGGGALVFSAALVVVALLYWRTAVSRTVLFWTAFILTRPLGATVGDLLDKPGAQGGFGFSRVTASCVLATLIVGAILWLPRRAGGHPGDA